MKRTVSILLALAMIFALCACSKDEPKPTKEPEPTPTPYEAVTVSNHDRLITVKKMPQKVVTIGPNCTELFCLLGLSGSVTGKCMDNHSRGAQESIAEAYDAIADISYGYPKLDDILDSDCDFVYALGWAFKDDLTVEALEKRGITVYVSEATTLEGIWKEIRDIGSIFKVSETAESFIGSELLRIDNVSKIIGDAAPVKVFVYDSQIGGMAYTAGVMALESRLIEAAGGENVCSGLESEWGVVEFENVLSAVPDYIIVHDYDGVSYDEKIKQIKADPYLSQLGCVQNDRFIKLSLENVLPGSRTALTVETIAQSIHADKYR